MLSTLPESLCEVLPAPVAFEFVFQTLRAKKLQDTDREIRSWECLLNAQEGVFLDLVLQRICVPKHRQVVVQLVNLYIQKKESFAAVLEETQRHLISSSQNTVYQAILLFQELLQHHLNRPQLVRGHDETSICENVHRTLLSIMKASCPQGVATRTTRETWNLFVYVMLDQMVSSKGEAYAWSTHSNVIDAIELWARINESSHHRTLLCQGLSAVAVRMKEVAKQRYDWEYACHLNPRDPSLKAVEVALESYVNRMWLSWGVILLDFPSCASPNSLLPSCILGGPCKMTSRPMAIYDTVEGIVRDVWGLLDGIQQCSQDNESHSAWKKDAILALALLIGKVPDMNREILLSRTLGNMKMETAIYDVFLHQVLRVSNLDATTYKISSKIIGIVISLPSANDVALDHFIPLLNERDAAGRCVVEIVSDLCCQHPTTALPQLFHLLDDTRATVRHNVLDIIDSLLQERKSLPRPMAERLTHLILGRLGDEDLTLRCQASKMVKVLPLDVLLPKLLELSSQHDGTGRIRGAALAALDAAAKEHCSTVTVLAISLNFAKAKSSRQQPATPRELTELKAPSTVEGKLLSRAVIHIAEKWMTYVHASKWDTLLAACIQIYLDDVTNSDALRVLVTLNSILSNYPDVVLTTILAYVKADMSVMEQLGPLLLLNTFNKSFYSQTHVSQCSHLWEFVISILAEESVPDDMKRVATMLLGKRSIHYAFANFSPSTPRDGFFGVCCAIMTCIQDFATPEDVDVFQRSSETFLRQLLELMLALGPDEKLGKACIDTLSMMALMELKCVQSSSFVKLFLLECVSSQCMKYPTLHRSLCFTAAHQALFHLRTNSALNTSTLAASFAAAYLMPLVDGANAACVERDFVTSISALGALFTLTQVMRPFLPDHVSTLADVGLKTMKFSQCPELQFEGTKLIGGLVANVTDFFVSQGSTYFSAVISQLGALALVHSVPACRQLAEELLGLLVKSE